MLSIGLQLNCQCHKLYFINKTRTGVKKEIMCDCNSYSRGKGISPGEGVGGGALMGCLYKNG